VASKEMLSALCQCQKGGHTACKNTFLALSKDCQETFVGTPAPGEPGKWMWNGVCVCVFTVLVVELHVVSVCFFLFHLYYILHIGSFNYYFHLPTTSFITKLFTSFIYAMDVTSPLSSTWPCLNSDVGLEEGEY